MTLHLETDYCVVGAGIAGLLLGERLLSSGKRVLVLDQGPEITDLERNELLRHAQENLDDTADYNDDLGPEWRTSTTSAAPSAEVAEYQYGRLFGIGGTALHFGAFLVRPIADDLQVRTRFGYGRDWPISYDELEPALLDAEQELGVAANEDNPYASRRSGPFPMPAHPFSWFDREIAAPALEKLGMTAHSCPTGVNSEPYDGRNECLACRFCTFCPSGARYSPDLVHGARIRRHERGEILAGMSLRRLELDAAGARVAAAHFRRVTDGEEVVVSAKHFALTMGGVATPRALMLSSGNGEHRAGLGNAGGQLGVGFGDHWNHFAIFDVGRDVGSRLGFMTLLCDHGRVNVDRGKGPSWLLAGAPLESWLPLGSLLSTWALDDDRLSLSEMRETLPRLASFWAMNETSGTGSIDLDHDALDRFGDPVAKVTLPRTDWDSVCGTRFENFVGRFGEVLDAKRVSPVTTMWPSGGHPTGTTAMGTSPDDGVCDSNQRVFGLDNLHLASGSVFPHFGAAAPTLTIAALALRLAGILEPSTKKARLMKSLLLRRTFLRLAAATPLALSSCAAGAKARKASDEDLEEALRRLVFAIGPWPEEESDVAEGFFGRFWSAVPVSERYLKDAALLRSASERIVPGTHAARELDLSGLTRDERDLVVDLADGLYSLFEIRAYVGREPTFGVCMTDRSQIHAGAGPQVDRLHGRFTSGSRCNPSEGGAVLAAVVIWKRQRKISAISMRSGNRGLLFTILSLAFLPGCKLADQAVPGEAVTPLRTEQIVYTTLAPDDWGVFLFESESGTIRELASHPALDYDPVFSPDGRWLVFTSEREGNPDLWALDLVAESDPIRVTYGPAMQDAAAFSPDGGSLAFVDTREGNAEIFVMPFRPEDPKAAFQEARNLTRSPRGDFRPAFSPDGHRIAFCSDRDSPFRVEYGDPESARRRGLPEQAPWRVGGDIYVMDSDGSNVTRLTNADGWDGSPAWSPDGDAIYFYSEREGLPRIWRMTPDGEDQESVSDRGGLAPSIVADGKIAFVAPASPTSSSWRAYLAAMDGTTARLEETRDQGLSRAVLSPRLA